MTLNKAYYIRLEIDNIKKQIESLEEFDAEKKIKLVERDIPTGLMRVTLDDGLEIVFSSDGEVI